MLKFDVKRFEKSLHFYSKYATSYQCHVWSCKESIIKTTSCSCWVSCFSKMYLELLFLWNVIFVIFGSTTHGIMSYKWRLTEISSSLVWHHLRHFQVTVIVYLLVFVTFYRIRSTFRKVWRQISGTFCTWTLTSTVMEGTPFPMERHVW